MPTSKPRLTLTLDQETYAVLSDLAELQGCSRSSLVVDLVGQALPVLERTIGLMRAFQDQQRRLSLQSDLAAESNRRQMLDSLTDAESILAPLLADTLGAFDRLSDDLSGKTQPPHSNTGVTPPNTESSEKGGEGTNALRDKHLRHAPVKNHKNEPDGGQDL